VKARFEALSQSDQQKILDKHRYYEVSDFDWYDCIYDDFKESMKVVGIQVDEIYFSGFASQGDGAMFEGRVDDWPKFLASISAPECFNHEDIYDSLSFSVKHRGHYYHRNSTSYSSDADLTNGYSEGTIRWHAIEALIEECEQQLDALWDSCEEAFKDHMNDLYKNLEEEYDYLTSNEYVLERLIETDQLEEELDELDESAKAELEKDMAEV
jgi:hypothetical protein